MLVLPTIREEPTPPPDFLTNWFNGLWAAKTICGFEFIDNRGGIIVTSIQEAYVGVLTLICSAIALIWISCIHPGTKPAQMPRTQRELGIRINEGH